MLVAMFILDQQVDIYFLKKAAAEDEVKLKQYAVKLSLAEAEDGDKGIKIEEMQQALTKASVEIVKNNYRKVKPTKKLVVDQLF